MQIQRVHFLQKANACCSLFAESEQNRRHECSLSTKSAQQAPSTSIHRSSMHVIRQKITHETSKVPNSQFQIRPITPVSKGKKNIKRRENKTYAPGQRRYGARAPPPIQHGTATRAYGRARQQKFGRQCSTRTPCARPHPNHTGQQQQHTYRSSFSSSQEGML